MKLNQGKINKLNFQILKTSHNDCTGFIGPKPTTELELIGSLVRLQGAREGRVDGNNDYPRSSEQDTTRGMYKFECVKRVLSSFG